MAHAFVFLLDMGHVFVSFLLVMGHVSVLHVLVMLYKAYISQSYILIVEFPFSEG